MLEWEKAKSIDKNLKKLVLSALNLFFVTFPVLNIKGYHRHDQLVVRVEKKTVG